MFRINCLDRYIVRLWALPFIGILLLVLAVFVIQNLLIWLPVLIDQGATLDLTTTLLLSLMPNVLLLAIPIAYFFALQRIVTILQDSSELDAMYAGGLSLFNVFRSLLMLGFMLSMLLMWMTMELAPSGKVATYNSLQKLSALKTKPSFIPQRFSLDIEGLTFYMQGENMDGSYANVMFSDSRKDALRPIIYVAERAVIKNTDTGLLLQLEHGDQLSSLNGDVRNTHFEQYSIPITLDLEESFRALSSTADRTFMDGKTLYDSLQMEDVDVRHIAEWHNRLVTPLTVLILFFFALPISLHAKRAGHGASFFIALAVMLSINQSQLIVYKNIALGVLPWWSLWGLMALFASVAFWLFYRVSRHGSLSFSWKKAKRR